MYVRFAICIQILRFLYQIACHSYIHISKFNQKLHRLFCAFFFSSSSSPHHFGRYSFHCIAIHRGKRKDSTALKSLLWNICCCLKAFSCLDHRKNSRDSQYSFIYSWIFSFYCALACLLALSFL